MSAIPSSACIQCCCEAAPNKIGSFALTERPNIWQVDGGVQKYEDQGEFVAERIVAERIFRHRRFNWRE